MKPKKIAAFLLSLVMLAGMIPFQTSALSGEAEYTPAESNISPKYWVSFSADEGNAALAADDDLETAWTWTSNSAALLADLGGVYDAVHKIETVFADGASVYQYKIEGSTDGQTWTVLADRTENEAPGAQFADVFAFEGLRYVRLTVEKAGAPGLKEFRILNYLRPDLNNGSDSSTVSKNVTYYYNLNNDPPAEGIRGGQLTPETMNTGNNYFGLVKDLGWDTTRLRVWNEPRSEGDWRYAADVNEAINLTTPPSVGTSCSPETQLDYAKYIVGAGQELAIDFHYADSWADPQNQPKPYAWAELPFDELVEQVYQFTYDYIEKLIQQDTAPTIVAIGNEITNGMMWGSEYLEVNEFADYHDYYKRFIRDNSADNLASEADQNGNHRTIDGRKLNPNATPGGGVKWLKYAEANGDTGSAAYKEFEESVANLAKLVDAGNRALAALNEKYDLDIQSEMHFAFNVVEQPRGGDKVEIDPDVALQKVKTLIGLLAEDLDGMGGMVDRIGVSYYPDWHGSYDVLQRNLVELSQMLPDVAFNIAECRPDHSGTINDRLDNPNYPVGTEYTPQLAGDIAIDIMKTINDIPNNAGKGVWPWNGQSIYGVAAPGAGWNATDYTLQASFKAWNDAFAKNVVESSVSVLTTVGQAPKLPATVKSLDLATGEISDVAVKWGRANAPTTSGTYTVSGTASVTVPSEGKGKAMDQVTATVTVLPNSSASGQAEYTPAESNISGKYWVKFSSGEGDAALAADGDWNTAWTWTSNSAELLVDLGGVYDEIHKIETVFADGASVYQYKIQGSSDNETWTVLADRTGNSARGANYSDVFAFPGLRYLKLTVDRADVPGVKEFQVINYLRRDMNNGSDSSGVSKTLSYHYDPNGTGTRGGQLTPETMNTGNNYFGLVKDLGWDVTRVRVWNEPRSEGDWRFAADVNEAIDLTNPPSVGTNCSPETQLDYAKYITGAGQQLAIDFHYSDSWADPQNQPKPYAWAELPFDELVNTVYQFTYDYIEDLIEQGTAPTIVAIGNEITNGMMWGSEYLEVNEYADYHDYYKRFIRDNSPENLESEADANGNHRTIDGRKLNPNATPGGGVKWVKYAEANGNTDSAAYKEFEDSVANLAKLVDAGNRAITALNEKYGLDIQSEMHFAFNVIEQPRGEDKVELDDAFVFGKVTTLIGLLAEDLNGMGGMVDRIGVSYYPDWHGTYAQLQRNLVELSKMLPDVAFNIAECSPAHSGKVNDRLDNPNYPVGTEFTPQIAGDIAIDIMKTINDVPNNAGQGVWPWNGQSVYGVREDGNDYTLYASFKAWNDAFAKNVVESSVSATATAGQTPALPETVKSLDLATGAVSDVKVSWDSIDADLYAEPGTFTVSGTAAVTVPGDGKGKAMDQVTATVTVVKKSSGGSSSGGGGGSSRPTTPSKPVTPSKPATGFTDVAAGAYYENAVKWAVENKITSGTSETTFSPDDSCTRAQIVTFLWAANGRPEVESTTNFRDVPADAYYAKAVAWAVANGITSGTEEGVFSPDATCTRAQAMTFLWAAAGRAKVQNASAFADVPANAYYADAVAWAVANDITAGVGDGLFGSDNTCTRGQIVTFLFKAQ